jgi:hypothetical protein
MKNASTAASEERLTDRICSEYREMPGLQLTSAQARRLFGLDEPQCTRLLDDLVAGEFLVRRPGGRYALKTDVERRPPSLHQHRRVGGLAIVT